MPYDHRMRVKIPPETTDTAPAGTPEARTLQQRYVDELIFRARQLLSDGASIGDLITLLSCHFSRPQLDFIAGGANNVGAMHAAKGRR